MCLILCAYKSHPRYHLVVAANRDEFLARPTAGADWWDDASDILGGRDLEQMGTWLGCTRGGRFAAVTNYREPGSERRDAPSRGGLVREFLESDGGVEEFLSRIRAEGGEYNGYNLLFGADGSLGYHSNRGDGGKPLESGIYGISNHLLDTPWPKVRRGKARFTNILSRHRDRLPADELFEMLGDRTRAPDDELPDTGLGIELERMVSPIFTVGKEYGTRCSTVFAIDHEGSAYFEERDAGSGRSVSYSFDIAYRNN